MEGSSEHVNIRRGLSLRFNFTLQSINILSMMVVLIVMISLVRSTMDLLERDQAKATVCQLLATELKQSSEDLTNSCRMYIVSGGQVAHWNEYHHILDWRSGAVPRPANLPKNLHPGVTIDMMSLLEESGFTAEELYVVEHALSESDRLAVTEVQAMESMRQGRFVDGPEKMREGESIQDFAMRIVTSDSYNAISHEILSPLDTLVADITERMSDETIALNKRMTVYEVVMVVVAVAVMLSMSVFVVFLRRSLLEPILQTSKALSVVSDSDLTPSLAVKTHNEVGQMFLDFNVTMEHLRTLIHTIQTSSRRLSETGSDLVHHMSDTANSVHHMSETIANVKGEALTQAASVEETTATVTQIIETIKKLNQSVLRQAASVTQSSASVEEMVANIAAISQTLDRSDDKIKDLATATTKGRDTVANATEVTRKISDASGGLMEASGIIQHIASQTNLLAMNAAIEAAHAGEAGQGFAVVADEIRKLAEESSMQGKAITTTLKSLSGDIATLSQATRTVEEQFSTIYNMSEDILQMSSQMNLAMQEQDSGSQEVLVAIRDINAVTQEVRAGSDEMLHGSEIVVSEMRRLIELTNDITASMNDMATDAAHINDTVKNVNKLTVENKDSIHTLADEIHVFKVE